MQVKNELIAQSEKIEKSAEILLKEILEIQENLIKLETQIDVQKELVKKADSQLSSKTAVLSEKKQIIIHFEAYQALLKLLARLEDDLSKISQTLTDLSREKETISAALDGFKLPNHAVKTSAQLSEELENKKKLLAEVEIKIFNLIKIQDAFHFLYKALFSVLLYLGLISDPLTENQKLSTTIETEITILEQKLHQSNSLNQLDYILSQYESLSQTQNSLSEEKRNASDELNTLVEKEPASKLYSGLEFDQEISKLEKHITKIRKDFEETQVEHNNLEHNLKLALELKQPLIKKKQEMTDQKKAKTTQWALLKDEQRKESKRKFKETLIDIAKPQPSHENEPRSPLFFSLKAADYKSAMVANYIALAKIREAIEELQKQLNPKRNENQDLTVNSKELRACLIDEAQYLSAISSKLLLWQIAEETKHLGCSYEERTSAHQCLCDDLNTLVEKLPIDNPVRAIITYIQNVSSPKQQGDNLKTSNR